jgi:hypothetical protein
MFGSSLSVLKASSEMVGMNQLGLMVGQEAMARISPVFGSMKTIAPRFTPRSSVFSHSRWRSVSRVVTRL